MVAVPGFPKLSRTNAGFQFRGVYPKHLRKIIGASELKRSLGTDSLSDAKLAWAELSAEFDRVKGEAQQVFDGAKPADHSLRASRALTLREAERLVRSWHAFRLKSEFDILANLPRSERTSDARKRSVQEQIEGHGDLRHWKWRRSAADVIQHLCEQHGFETPLAESPVWNRFADRVIEARVDVLKRVLARMDDDFTDSPLRTDPSFLKPVVDATPLHPGSHSASQAKPPLSLKAEIQKYVEDRGRAISEQTRQANKGRLRLLPAYFGDEHDIRYITSSDMEAFRETILDLPRDPFRALPNTPLADMPALAKSRGLQVSSRNNSRIVFETVSSFFKRLVDRGLIDRNPCAGLAIKKDARAERKRHPFSPATLETLFSSSIFAPGHTKFDSSYWVPLIGLFTGMRLGEICQLWTDDLSEVDGVQCIRIRHSEAREQRLKTGDSERIIPIHKELERLGLSNWWQTKQGTPPERLFPEIPKSASDTFSDAFSKRFAYQMKKLGLAGQGLVFHSFRHTFVDGMRNAGLDEATQKAIGGWKAKDVHAQYGQGPAIPRIKQEIDRVWFSDSTKTLDLGNIAVWHHSR